MRCVCWTCVAALAAAALAGCSDSEPAAKGPQQPADPIAGATAQATTADGISDAGAEEGGTSEAIIRGRVVEVVAIRRSTYLRLSTDGGDKWVAVAKHEVPEGTDVVIERAMPVPDYRCATSGRSFSVMHFGVLRGAPDPTRRPSAPPRPLPDVIEVPKAIGANAATVAEVIGGAGELRGQTVRVQAMVVRVSSNIMDRNWIHLRDGSGSEDDEDHDLLVWSQETPAVGHVVVVTGRVSLADAGVLGVDGGQQVVVQAETIVSVVGPG